MGGVGGIRSPSVGSCFLHWRYTGYVIINCLLGTTVKVNYKVQTANRYA